jgi:hypothetical protein
MKFLAKLLFVASLVASLVLMFDASLVVSATQECKVETFTNVSAPNGCISFTVGSGTGCAWMCEHCADALGPSYYFPDGVCAYQAGGCVGSPQAGVSYTCCST